MAIVCLLALLLYASYPAKLGDLGSNPDFVLITTAFQASVVEDGAGMDPGVGSWVCWVLPSEGVCQNDPRGIASTQNRAPGKSAAESEGFSRESCFLTLFLLV